jgi:3-dehydroquinate synthase
MFDKTIPLNTGWKKCEIRIGSWKPLIDKYDKDDLSIYLTDQNVYDHYRDFLSAKKTIILTPGERSKSFSIVEGVYKELVDMNADRSSRLIGFGGGVVTDIAGFIASTYMRGIDFGFVSTTLLGQVDAVIGGKNGINLDGFKNMIGTFNQPSFIINDPSFFNTLPEKEFINGMSEVLKQFMITDHEGLQWFIDNRDQIYKKESNLLHELIFRQNMIKARIVEQDEKEHGVRRILNFGHSFGHAIEKELKWPHGHAVAAGMVIALRLSHFESHLTETESDELINLISSCGLRTGDHLRPLDYIETMKKDKKKNKDSIDFILLEKPGKATVKPYNFDKLANIIKQIKL